MLEINRIYNENCLDGIKKLDDNSVDSIVTDPPYELGFMGKAWDKTGIAYNVDLWKECLRVLKPGGYLLAFGGTRTYHRMACAIEDAGFEIRDTIMWIYGSGFPKSLNIGKEVDKLQGNERTVIGEARSGNTSKAFNDYEYRVEQEIYSTSGEYKITKGNTEWNGWGTALKPANEPICMARKPISEKTIADNVIKWGTGGINIDGCRIGEETTVTIRTGNSGANGTYGKDNRVFERENPQGRFPANVIFDEEAGKMLDEQSGTLKSGSGIKNPKNGAKSTFRASTWQEGTYTEGDSGGASRFFYCPKASTRERNMGLNNEPTTVDDGRNKPIDNPYLRGKTLRKNTHPTVKPIKLMEYLITLVTPPNGIVLEPFIGSGTTLIAAKKLHFKYIAFELNKEYCEISEARLSANENNQLDLLEDLT